ncbi:MAG: O-antigen ligase family protein [Oligoflexia bacterium]|nr:O-antigen ligase family protein [Oligoflexia bacterium]
MTEFTKENQGQIWRWALATYGMLSLSSMAGMGIGGALFILCTLVLMVVDKSLRESFFLALRTERAFLYASGFIFLSAALSLFAAKIWPPDPQLEGFKELKKFHYFLYPFFIGFALKKGADQIERHPFWFFYGLAFMLCGVIAGVQFFAKDLFPAEWLSHRFFRSSGNTGRYHGQGLMFFHLSFASAMTFGVALGLSRLLWPLKWEKLKSRLYWTAVAILSSLGLYFSFSRIGLLALVSVIVFLLFLKKPKIGLIGVVLTALLIFGLWTNSTSLRDRFLESRAGMTERVYLWAASWEMFIDRPIVGFGFGRSASYTPKYIDKILNGEKPNMTSHAHNNILDTLASTGLVGVLAYFLWFGLLISFGIRAFLKSENHMRWLSAAALAGMLGFQINGLTQVNFWDGKSQHSLMIWAGILVALNLRTKKVFPEQKK